jgi:phospholipase/lecithinase/hemolysin
MKAVALAEAYRISKAYEDKLQPCDHPEQYVFWDQLHPTTVTHNIIAKAVEDQMAASGFVQSNQK